MNPAFDNAMKAAATRALALKADARVGIISGYDPANYCAKVTLQPTGQETGWLPVLSPWVGDQWGLFCPPSIGEQVHIDFQEGDVAAGIIPSRFFCDTARPLPAPSGEFWLVHKSGSLVKFHNDGSVEMSSATDMTLTAAGTMRIVGKDVQLHGTSTLRYDANGQGVKLNGNNVESWQDNDGAPVHHNHQPPEIG